MTGDLSPKQRLASSRASLLAAMGYAATDTNAGPRIVAIASEDGRQGAAGSDRARKGVGRSVVGRWWRRSHLSTVAELGKPLLQDYASRYPAKLVTYAAGTGALIVLVKPWRLLSLGMMVGLLLRSTDVSGLLSDHLVPELGDTDNPRDDFLDRPPKKEP
ncbi:hypothetical protein M2282_005227 [Variovorax boronicumulans]|uniref:hypothetical protein n=1 Tax=Variovorax boronicumulans TaxID=436515 RepID=UPI0024751C14|nr:hypothetical protein [Variovorax boronicumulans]MDH6170057.1 hypothetical protein [Variovorax boronicumulans]